MDISLILAIGTTILGALGWAIRAFIVWKADMEKQIASRITESEVRQIITDKIEPLKYNLEEAQRSLAKVYDILIKKSYE